MERSCLSGTGDLYQHMLFPGGCIQQSLMENWLTAVGAMGSYATFLNNSLFDTFWQNMSLQMNNRYQSVNIPALHIGGWFDIFDQEQLMVLKIIIKEILLLQIIRY